MSHRDSDLICQIVLVCDEQACLMSSCDGLCGLSLGASCAPLEVEELNILHHFFNSEMRLLNMSSYSRLIKGPINIAEGNEV